LIFLVSGLPALVAQTSVGTECCHTTHKKKQETHSCCEMPAPKEEKQEETKCDIFEMNSSTMDNCGCIHELINLDNSVLTKTNFDFSKTIAEIDSGILTNDEITNQTEFYITEIPYHYKVPIYISVSSYLI